jgi:hypothetical protein
MKTKFIIIALSIVLSLTVSQAEAAFKAASASPTSITLSWTAPGDDGGSGQAAQYDLRYSTAPITFQNFAAATAASGEPTPQPAGNAESYTVVGLLPGTSYYFAIKTADEAGNWSPMSNVVSSATDNETNAPGTIADLTAILPTENSLTLIWTAPGDDGNVGQASQYDIRMSTATITDQNFLSAIQFSNIPTPKAAGQVETLTVAGLDTANTYYFAIKTADEVPNWSALSNIATGTTSEDQTAPGAITDLQASTGSDLGEIDLSWNCVGDDDMSGSATLYEVRYSLNRITPSNWIQATLWPQSPIPMPAGQTQAATVAGLNQGQWYWVGMKVYDEAGNQSSMSNIDSAIAHFNFGTDIDDDGSSLPDVFSLQQNYPNPFNPTTEIAFSLPEAADTRLVIYNIYGQQVASLLETQLPAGDHTVQWDGRNSSHQDVASGVYFYRLEAGSFRDTKKMMMVK